MLHRISNFHEKKILFLYLPGEKKTFERRNVGAGNVILSFNQNQLDLLCYNLKGPNPWVHPWYRINNTYLLLCIPTHKGPAWRPSARASENEPAKDEDVLHVFKTVPSTSSFFVFLVPFVYFFPRSNICKCQNDGCKSKFHAVDWCLI